jgi:hypothetical protein
MAAVRALTADGLFRGQSRKFLAVLTELAKPRTRPDRGPESAANANDQFSTRAILRPCGTPRWDAVVARSDPRKEDT